jgi:hypothetical protein
VDLRFYLKAMRVGMLINQHIGEPRPARMRAVTKLYSALRIREELSGLEVEQPPQGGEPNPIHVEAYPGFCQYNVLVG